jgi:hypothetical protein
MKDYKIKKGKPFGPPPIKPQCPKPTTEPDNRVSNQHSRLQIAILVLGHLMRKTTAVLKSAKEAVEAIAKMLDKMKHALVLAALVLWLLWQIMLQLWAPSQRNLPGHERGVPAQTV